MSYRDVTMQIRRIIIVRGKYVYNRQQTNLQSSREEDPSRHVHIH